jgi:putative MATE family efflux protein
MASEQAIKQYDKMTKTPVGKLIIALGIPTTISMLITNLYNMADSFFVSQISVSAGGATGVVFSIMAILQAFGFMFGHGAGSLISRSLGSGESKKASVYASTGFFSAFLCGLLISLFGLIFIKPFMRLLGSTETILPHAIDYATFILIAAPFMTASCVLNNVLRYEGKASLAMIGLTTGGLINIGLDPLFIFALDLGIMGAGIATAISQLISFFILLSIFFANKTQSKLSIKNLTKDFTYLKEIVLVGLPSLARQGLNSVSTMVLNMSAKPFGDPAIASMGYVVRVFSLVFSVGLGIGQGFQPVCAFNYGAKKYSRVKKGSFFTLYFGTVFIGIVSLTCFIFAEKLMGIFGGNAEVVRIGSRALRIYCVALLFFPVSVVATMLFQSIGKSRPALILSCLQSGLIFIPLCLILPRFIDLLGVQISQPIAYVLSAFVSFPLMIRFIKSMPQDSKNFSEDENV